MQTVGHTSGGAIEAHLSKWGGLWLLLLGALTLLAGTAQLPLVDRDEPRFTRATQEMSASGQWVIPTFNGENRFDKPPLTYWWMGLNHALLGETEQAARLHSVVASLLCAVALWGLGRRLFGATSGFLAGMAFLSCVQVQIHGRLAVADMPMVLAVIIAQWAAWDLLHRKEAPLFGKAFWTLWLALAFGFLAKGPIALLVPVLAWLLYRWLLWRAPLPWGHLQWFNGPLLLLILVGLWGVPALLLTQGGYWDVGMGTHIIDRGTEAFNGRFSLPFYYLLSALLSLMPWLAFFGAAWAKMRHNWDARNAWLAAWFLAPYLIFSLYATQLPHYVLPGFGAFFLILFQPVDGRILPLSRAVKRQRAEQLWFRSVTGFWVLLALTVLGTLLLVEFSAALMPLKRALGGVLLALAGWVGLALAWRSRPATACVAAFGCLLAVGSGMLATATHLRPLLPAVQLEKTFEQVSQAALRSPEPKTLSLFHWQFETQPQAKPVSWTGIGYAEPSLVYYSGETWSFEPELQTPMPLTHFDGQEKALLVLAREWRLEDFFSSLASHCEPLEAGRDFRQHLPRAMPDGYRLKTIRGVNLARFSWVELKLFLPTKANRGD
jgi:4-amino-4-deoxy-L-arabinose transferase-like glycosyltransferase